MTKNFIASGCSFTYGHELSDDVKGEKPSNNTWAYKLFQNRKSEQYVCSASAGSGNSGIARRTFEKISNSDVDCVVVMWSFLSRYDWAMPRHSALEKTRWASISPWDTNSGNEEAFRTIQGSETQSEQWRVRRQNFEKTGVRPFAEAIYKHAANQYHEVYLSWKSIVWLQNLLEKKNIPYMFTLADNSLFFNETKHHRKGDPLLRALHNEIDMSKWFSFGDRMMGFNQWALLNDYPRGTTHPLDEAHADAVQLMLPTFNKLIGEK